ncbi:MAG: GxxExxY protein [Calditrichaeota bacterium]|nr:GxxExxY protein [Calditrichota bacterium]
MKLIFEEESYQIIGAAQEVHRVLGPGFLEKVYQDALEEELKLRRIEYQREIRLPVHYKDVALEAFYAADFVCHDKIIVETKALSHLGSEHQAQVMNYLKATDYRLGLLINFGELSLKVKRIVK